MEELKRYCEHYGEDYDACLVLLNYYKKIGWTESRAVEYIKDLIAEGVIEEIKKIGGSK